MKSVVVDLKVPDLSAVANFQTVHARAHNEFIPTLWCSILSVQIWFPRRVQRCCTCALFHPSSLSPYKNGFIFPISHHLVLDLQGTELFAAFFSWNSWGGCEPKICRETFGVWVVFLHLLYLNWNFFFGPHVPLIFWHCFFTDLGTPGGLRIELHRKISHLNERSVCQEKPENEVLKKHALLWWGQITPCPSPSTSVLFENKSILSSRDFQTPRFYLIKVWTRNISYVGEKNQGLSVFCLFCLGIIPF